MAGGSGHLARGGSAICQMNGSVCARRAGGRRSWFSAPVTIGCFHRASVESGLTAFCSRFLR